ncbi:unnamed protein product, partial [Didymodactylos carnosus]
ALETMTPDEINRIEPNGSTALHAASFFGHADIVRLILEKPSASRSIRNKYGLTAAEEAKNVQIQELFQRQNGTNRFIGEANIEWRKVDQNILKEIAEKRKEFNVEWKNPNIDYYVNAIRRDYLDNSLRNIKSIDVIRWFFSKAAKEQDPTYLVKAYTVEADYYKVLNQQLSTTHESDRHDFATDGRRRLLQILTSHPSLERYTFSGHTYRSMYVTEDELKDYYVGTRFMNKTFLSTSKDRQIAEIFSISSKKSDQ